MRAYMRPLRFEFGHTFSRLLSLPPVRIPWIRSSGAWARVEQWRSLGGESWGSLVRIAVSALLMGATLTAMMARAQSSATGKLSSARGPVWLECESLVTPLGVDTKDPVLSWQLKDEREGARQTAYQIQVASQDSLLATGKADVWDSGRVESDDSRNIRYAGPPLRPTTRYYWHVRVWDKEGKAYPTSNSSWWETGLQDAQTWKGRWIGYEEPEEKSVRESGAVWITNPEIEGFKETRTTRHDFRLHFDLTKPVKRAVLYVAGQDSPAAWINGKQVVEAEPLPSWKSLPWKKYTVRDITGPLQSGQNLLAIEVLLYETDRRTQAPENYSRTPMSAVLYVEGTDGTVQIFKSGEEGWKSALDASGTWPSMEFDDSAWKQAVRYVHAASVREGSEVGHAWPTGTVKMLRKTLEISKPVMSARLYATALGAYKFSINGKAVGDQILAPGWTDYRERVVYQAYDVTGLVRTGKNAVAALVAAGWYGTPLGWLGQGHNYGTTSPVLKAQMRVEYKDGTVDWIATDESWKANVSPILRAEIYDGEHYDARRLQVGWDTATFADDGWKSAEVIAVREPEVVWQSFEPIRAERVLEAKTMSNPTTGVYIYDFGQNFAGVPVVRVEGPAGTDIKLRLGEVLNADGSLYVDNLRSAKATDHFILAGRGTEEYQPTFTFHGFRYVEMSGLERKPGLHDVKAVVFHTDASFTAKLETGSAMLNKLWSNILWGQRSNFVGVPTDCPQRDERLGWTGDAEVFWRTASYNMDLTAFSRKYAADLRGTQAGTDMYGIYAPGTQSRNAGYATGWSDAGVIVPWTSWIQTGDKRVVEENWASMERYLAAIQAANPNYLWRKNYGIAFADWLSPEGVTPVDLIATAYWAYDVTLMKQMAQAIGKTSDERKYGDLFEQIKAAFNQTFVRPDGFVGGVPPRPAFAPGMERPLSDKPVETQTGYVLALYMNLLPDALRQLAAKQLIDRLEMNHWRLGTGFLGTPYLLAALTDTGHADVAYRLLLSTEYPSWGYLVEHGATTMWERWNADQMMGDPRMNSYNHYAYGAVADWIYRYAAGIDTVAPHPGFHTVLLHPNFDARLGTLNLTYQSAYGTIWSAWSISGRSAMWKITLPANTKGRLPIAREQKQSFKIDGQALSHSSRIRLLGSDGGREVYEIPAGTYTFEVNLQ
jgi:alpha-L-rhamnosidase